MMRDRVLTLSRQTFLAMTRQLMPSAKKKWRKRDGQNRQPESIAGVEFGGGIKHQIKAARSDRHDLSATAPASPDTTLA